MISNVVNQSHIPLGGAAIDPQATSICHRTYEHLVRIRHSSRTSRHEAGFQADSNGAHPDVCQPALSACKAAEALAALVRAILLHVRRRTHEMVRSRALRISDRTYVLHRIFHEAAPFLLAACRNSSTDCSLCRVYGPPPYERASRQRGRRTHSACSRLYHHYLVDGLDGDINRQS